MTEVPEGAMCDLCGVRPAVLRAFPTGSLIEEHDDGTSTVHPRPAVLLCRPCWLASR